MVRQRVLWIDCAKFIAILAVAFDHCYGTLYTNKTLWQLSYFSVGVFVLLSGISSFISYDNKLNINICFNDIYIYNPLRRIIKLLSQYAIATLIIYVIKERFFDLIVYLKYLTTFSLLGPYYFIVFFIQIIAISPLILDWISYINKRRKCTILHFISIIVLVFFSRIFMNYSLILSLHGGGKYLFGATFLILFYLGGYLYKMGIFDFQNHRKFILCLLDILLLIFSCLSICHGRILDTATNYFLGEGLNPPGFDSMLYSLSVTILLFLIFSEAEKSNNKYVKGFLKRISFLGQHTMVIFLYHTAILSVLAKLILPRISTRLIMILIYMATILLPVFGFQIAVQLKKFLRKNILVYGRLN